MQMEIYDTVYRYVCECGRVCVNGISCVVMCLKLVSVIRLTGRGICQKYEQIILKINNRNLQNSKKTEEIVMFMWHRK